MLSIELRCIGRWTCKPDIRSSVVTMPGERLCKHTFLMPPIFNSACRTWAAIIDVGMLVELYITARAHVAQASEKPSDLQGFAQLR